jgi:hypothetical protein
MQSDEHAGQLWQIINVWLSTRDDMDVFIMRSATKQYWLTIADRFDRRFAVIGDDGVAIMGDGWINAADPEFFNRLNIAIESAKNR